jgi:hypothetical protein
MSQPLEPTKKNSYIFGGIIWSVKDFARNAIGSDVTLGEEGFKDFSAGGWNHHWHYQRIHKEHPTLSPPEAIDEMADVRLRMVDHIMVLADQLDAALMRLAKMEDEMRHMIEKKAIDDQATAN